MTVSRIDEALFELEKRALVGDRDAVLKLVSLCRAYRQAVRVAKLAAYTGGTIDRVDAGSFFFAVDEAEDTVADEDDSL